MALDRACHCGGRRDAERGQIAAAIDIEQRHGGRRRQAQRPARKRNVAGHRFVEHFAPPRCLQRVVLMRVQNAHWMTGRGDPRAQIRAVAKRRIGNAAAREFRPARLRDRLARHDHPQRSALTHPRPAIEQQLGAMLKSHPVARYQPRVRHRAQPQLMGRIGQFDPRCDNRAAADECGPRFANPVLEQPFSQADSPPQSTARAFRRAAIQSRPNGCPTARGSAPLPAPESHSRLPCPALRHRRCRRPVPQRSAV